MIEELITGMAAMSALSYFSLNTTVKYDLLTDFEKLKQKYQGPELTKEAYQLIGTYRHDYSHSIFSLFYPIFFEPGINKAAKEIERNI
ncbi:MAG: hypothetical protein KC535_03425 [Nanoarchaeota archaeon]|nr:hypothetical protein [Nanoarchaeota archaeon]